jgi:hypothetical protein
MKKIIIALASASMIYAGTNQANAQGLLGKLKDKVGQAGTSGFGGGDIDWNGFPVATKKEGQKDIDNTKIDGTDYVKDKAGINGIYIAQKPIGVLVDNKLDKTIQKFVIETSPDGQRIKLSHNAIGDRYKPFEYGQMYEHSEVYQEVYKKLAAQGVFFSFQAITVARDSRYTDSIQYEGKPAKNGVSLQFLSLLEPGVFVYHMLVSPKNGVTTCDGGSKIAGEEEPNQWNYITFNLLVKKGKDASKWTNEAIVKELKRQSDMHCAMQLGGYAANAKMPEKVTGFKDEPANAALLKAAQGRAKEFGWKETVTSVYPTSEWANEYKLLGINQLNTLIARKMEINVIMKTPSGECAIETMVIRQDNIFTTGSTDEKFTGKPVYGYANGNLTPIDCAKTKK